MTPAAIMATLIDREDDACRVRAGHTLVQDRRREEDRDHRVERRQDRRRRELDASGVQEGHVAEEIEDADEERRAATSGGGSRQALPARR